jgi:hypothetical protein
MDEPAHLSRRSLEFEPILVLRRCEMSRIAYGQNDRRVSL